MITAKNIIYHELVGLYVKVEKSTNPSMVGLEGEVIKETKNMLWIRNDKGEVKKLPKKGNVFLFQIEDKIIKVLGEVLIGRPEERLKRKKIRIWKILGGEWDEY